MKNYQTQNVCLMDKLFFNTDFNIENFKSDIQQLNSKHSQNNIKQKSIIFTIIDTLIIEQKFYDYFCASYFKSNSFNKQDINKNQKQILNFGFKIIESVFSSQQLIQNDNFVLNSLLKKCKLDIFLLIAMCRGYLHNLFVRKDKVKSFFIQNFKKNNHYFVGLQRFCQFHQLLVQKSYNINQFNIDICRKQRQNFKLNYFLDFYSEFKDFFPSTLQIDNVFFKMMMSIKLDTSQDTKVYDRFQKEYFRENSYHLTTSCKNIRFLIEFFRNSFNQKSSEFYPQKNFIKILVKYNKSQIDKIISFSEVGLTWNEQQISTTLGNLFKLGLTPITLNLLKQFLCLWLKNGCNQIVLRVSQTYIPKIFIFLKHQKLFDISLGFLQQLTLGPRISTHGIMSKLLQKLVIFAKKQCSNTKKLILYQFMVLVETKYQKIATLEDKLYIELKKFLKNIRQVQKIQLLKNENVQEKLKTLEWEQIKVPLFGINLSSNQAINYIEKESGQYKGLYNIGNSCYMNSFLQCLYMNIEFRKTILELSPLSLEKNILQKMHQNLSKSQQAQSMTQNTQKNKNNNLLARQSVGPMAQLQRLFAQLTKSKRPAISPTTIKNISSPEFKNSFQQDTIEFGRSFLDTIARSSVDNIFEGQQTNQIICPNCKKSRFKKQNFIDLMLTEFQEENQKIDQRSSNTTKQTVNEGLIIQKMLAKFFETEQMQGLSCDFCQTKSEKSIKKHFISKFPNYLILTMKRFHYDVKQNKNVKKHYNVDLKQCFMNLEGQSYQLYGIIVHRGQSANSGHYFSFCRQWEFNDLSDKNQAGIQINQLNEKQHNQSQMIDQITQPKLQKVQKMQIQDNHQIQMQKEPQSILIKNGKQKISLSNKDRRWLCFNDSNVSIFESFSNVKQFLQLNQQDTPYILFYQKVSHVSSVKCQYLKETIKLREPLEKFLQKDNIEYSKFLENKRKGNQNGGKVDWKNFGKVKGFTAYDYFKFSKDDDQQRGNGFGGGGFGNMPIL